jgi:hypothetical protein
MIRLTMLALLGFTLAACQPKPVVTEAEETAPAESAFETTPGAEGLLSGWTSVADSTAATLTWQDTPESEPFKLTCTKTGNAMIAGAPVSQVALSNMAYPYALVFAAESFPADLVPGLDGTPFFEVSAPVTPQMLAALSGATTARISVNDSYAFAESGVDTADTFEQFVASCSALTGIAAAP